MRILRLYYFFLLLFLHTGFCTLADLNTDAPRIRFTENKNQWPAHIRFRAEVPMGYMYLEKNTFTFDLANPDDMANVYYIKDNGI